MNKKNLWGIFLGVAALHVVLIACITVSGGCANPKVLEERTYIPAPQANPNGEKINPPQVAPSQQPAPMSQPAPVTDIIIEQPIVIEGPAFTQPVAKPVDTPAAGETTYTIEKGDSLSKIAKKHGVKTKELAAYNKISTGKILKIGEKIKIPAGGKSVAHSSSPKPSGGISKPHAGSTSAPTIIKPDIKDSKKSEKGEKKNSEKTEKAAAATAADDGTYAIKSGDNWWTVAKKFGVKHQALLDANKDAAGKSLQIGQKIVIPKDGKVAKAAEKASTAVAAAEEPAKPADATPATPAAPATADAAASDKVDDADLDALLNEGDKGAAAAPVASTPSAGSSETVMTHTVKSEGETLDKIAKQYGVKIDDIKKLNPGLPATDALKTGVDVKIPGQ